jgi:hypothetical protein
VQILTVLGFALPVAIYLWFLHHYGLNVVSGDQWNDVSIIGASYKGKLTLGALWAQFNENRLFFPYLIVLGLSRTVAFNVHIEQYLGACCQFGAVALIVAAHKRRSPETSWLAYCPVAILMLSVVQADNTLSGFQLAWWMIVVSLAGVIFLLDRKKLSMFALVAGVALAIVGTYSSVQGLFIWVAGLMLLYYRRRSAAQMSLWVAAAILSITLYFYGYRSTVGSSATAPHHLGDAIRYFFELVGSILGIPLTGDGLGANVALVFGCIVVGLALYALWSYGRHRDTESAVPIGLVLIVFGLLFALSTTYGRVLTGPAGAASSRYTTYDLLIVVGTYLTYVGRPPSLRGSRAVMRPSAHSVLPLLLGAVIVVQAIFGFVNGIDWARKDHAAMLGVAVATTDARKLPDHVVQGLLYPENPGFGIDLLRSDVQVLATHGLSLFSDEQSLRYYKELAAMQTSQGVFKQLAILFETRTSIEVPHSGTRLNGKTPILASVTNDPDVKKVEFELSNATSDRIIGFGRNSDYGWGFFWRPSSVPNGVYQLRSLAIDRNGHVTSSVPIRVTVRK